MAKKKPTPPPVASIRHKDSRKNIPTAELREDEHAPRTMLYPRDPSLDLQLVWKGKDEQDRADLAPCSPGEPPASAGECRAHGPATVM